MSFLIDEAFLPATLTVPPMTDEQFAEFCSEHPDLFFEVTAEGELVVMPPNFSLTGIRNQEIARQFADWARRDGRGKTGDSSTGFVLPNGARRSADLCWIPRDEIARLSNKEREGYFHLCPSFVIELRSQSDRIRALRDKMREWIANGAQLAWLIDPQTLTVEIYRPNQEPEILSEPATITAGDPIAGFTLDLQDVWSP